MRSQKTVPLSLRKLAVGRRLSRQQTIRSILLISTCGKRDLTELNINPPPAGICVLKKILSDALRSFHLRKREPYLWNTSIQQQQHCHCQTKLESVNALKPRSPTKRGHASKHVFNEFTKQRSILIREGEAVRLLPNRCFLIFTHISGQISYSYSMKWYSYSIVHPIEYEY
jgi:hypothetical protein